MFSADQTEITAANTIVGYFNSQLHQNHVTASKWWNSHQEDKQNGEWALPENWYAWAMYRHQVRGTGGEMFEFTFSEPTLSFICDHDALLRITIKSVDKITGNSPEVRETVQTKAIAMSYRVSTVHRSILGIDMKLGDHESRIRLLICDFDHATPTGEYKDVEDNHLQLHIGRYLSSYLKALQSGGHHALFFPPEFSEDDKRPDIHMLLAASLEDRVPLNNIFGCTVEMINGYLFLFWYTCAFVSNQTGQQDLVWDRSSQRATYKSWRFKPKSEFEGRYVSMEIGEPTATILCSREVILKFVLTEVSFYNAPQDGGNPNEKEQADYKTLTIELILDISASKSGIIILPESAKVCPVPLVEDAGNVEKVKKEDSRALTHFFVERYFKLIAAARLKYLFRRIEADYDFSPFGADFDGSWWMLEHNSDFGTGGADTSHIRDTTLKDFDVVIAVSQASINAQLLQRFKTEPSVWCVDGGTYNIEVKGVTIRLLDLESEAQEAQGTPIAEVASASGDGKTTTTEVPISRAIITVHVIVEATKLRESPNVKSESNSNANTQAFYDTQVAFEVDVRDYDHQTLLVDTRGSEYHAHGPCLDSSPQHVKDKDFDHLQHIYLDINNARFSPEYSLWDDETYSNPEKRGARKSLVNDVMVHYFPQLLKHGMHVLASVPIYKGTPAEGSIHRLTHMWYRTFTTDTTIAAGVTKEGSVTRPERILFVLGMVGKPPKKIQPLDHVSFKPSAPWLVRGRFSHGTMAISRRVFYDRLLGLLACVNARTTLELVSQGDEGKVTGNLVQQWAEHPERKSEKCDWRLVEAGKYDYSSKLDRKWSHERNSRSGSEYLIHCETYNELELPDISTLSSGRLEIKLSGMLKLEISTSDTHFSNSQTWSTKSSVLWNISIVIKTSTSGGVEVKLEGLDDIRLSKSQVAIKRRNINSPDADAILRNHLLKREYFDDVLEDLKELQGDWKYYYPASGSFTLCTPMSNLDGDLLFELRPLRTAAKTPVHNGTRTNASASPPVAQDSQVATAPETGPSTSQVVEAETGIVDASGESAPQSSISPSNTLHSSSQDTSTETPKPEDNLNQNSVGPRVSIG